MEQIFKKQYEALELELVEVAEDVITATAEVDYDGENWGDVDGF